MFQSLADLIYEAALVPDRWDDALAGACSLSDSAEGQLFLFREGARPRGRSTPNMQEEFDRFVAADVWQSSKSVQSAYRMQTASCVQIDDFLTPEEIAQDPVRIRLRAAGIGVNLCTAVPMPGGELVTFVFQRRLQDGRFPRQAIEKLETLRPHLARAGLISARLGLERAHAAVSALEAIGLPAAALTTKGLVVAANPLFETLSGVFRSAAFGKIQFVESATNALFQGALERAKSEAVLVGSIPVPAAEGHPPLVIHILPIRGAARDIFSGSHVLIAITKVRVEAPVPSPQVLHALFDLTPAEASLAAALVQSGLSLKETAQGLGIQFGTARKCLEHIFYKTGTNRQSQLISLLKSAQPIG